MTEKSATRAPVIPPPVIALVIALLMWVVAGKAAAPQLEFPGRAALAYGLAGVGVAIDLFSIAAFIRARTTVNPLAPARSSALVVSGLYRYSRNPMYLGMLLVLFGWGLWLGQPFAAVFIILFVILIDSLQIRPEEAALEAKFGEDYLAYKKRVRRWI